MQITAQSTIAASERALDSLVRGGAMKRQRNCRAAEPQAGEGRLLRSAIYTRVSTEHGLEQDFNSLHAQRESSEAYVRSQAHEGWRLVPGHYDDGGFSVPALQRDLRQRGIVSRKRLLSTGKVHGGVPMTNGPLSHLLRNRTYLGEINHRDRSWPGDHQPIIAPDLFDAVQQKLAANPNAHHAKRSRSGALLLGRIFDDKGNRMSPSHARKRPARYRYYVSCVLAQGRKDEAGSVSRVPAPDVERIVTEALRNSIARGTREAQLHAPAELEAWSKMAGIDDARLVQTLLGRAVIQRDCIELQLCQRHPNAEPPADRANEAPADGQQQHAPAELIHVPWTPPASRRRRDVLPPQADGLSVRPMPEADRIQLLQAIARARRWRDDLLSGRASGLDEIASASGLSPRSVRSTLNLAFLSPEIVRAIVQGRLRRGIGIARLADLPMDWTAQHQVLGISASRPDKLRSEAAGLRT